MISWLPSVFTEVYLILPVPPESFPESDAFLWHIRLILFSKSLYQTALATSIESEDVF